MIKKESKIIRLMVFMKLVASISGAFGTDYVARNEVRNIACRTIKVLHGHVVVVPPVITTLFGPGVVTSWKSHTQLFAAAGSDGHFNVPRTYN